MDGLAARSYRGMRIYRSQHLCQITYIRARTHTHGGDAWWLYIRLIFLEDLTGWSKKRQLQWRHRGWTGTRSASRRISWSYALFTRNNDNDDRDISITQSTMLLHNLKERSPSLRLCLRTVVERIAHRFPGGFATFTFFSRTRNATRTANATASNLIERS